MANTNKNINLNLTPIIIAGAVLAIVIVVVIVVVLKKNKLTEEQDEYLKDVGKQIDKNDLSYSNSDYIQFANRIYNAVKGLGTDEDAIYSVFSQMETESDVRKLINVFGSKDGMTMYEWLIDDLGNKELAKVNEILSKKGIDIAF